MSFLTIMNTVKSNKDFFYFLPRHLLKQRQQKSLKFILYDYITQNELMYNKETVIDDFYRAQKVFHIMTKYMRIKKAKISDNEHDIAFNSLKDYKSSLIIDIIHNGKTFTFYVRDLHTLWKRALLYCNELIAEPLKPKNPYNNLPFTNSHLYNIYFKMLFNGLTIDPIIHKHFKCNFNLSKFTYTNEADIVENAAKTYIEDTILSIHNYEYINEIKILFPYDTNNIYFEENVPINVKNAYISKMSKALSLLFLKLLSYQIPVLISRESIYTVQLLKEVKRLNKYIMGRPYLSREEINGVKKTVRYYYFEEDNFLY